MSGNSPIRIRKKDLETIKKLNTSAKRKSARLQKKFDIKVEVEIKKIEQFSTRKEFNQYVKEISKFTDYKSHRYVKTEAGAVLPRDLVQQAKKAVKEANKVRDKTAKKVLGSEFMDRGTGQGFSVEQSRYAMGDGRYFYLKPIKMNVERFRSAKEMQDYMDSVEKGNTEKAILKRDREFRKNYIKALKNVFGKASASLRKKVQSMELSEFMRMFYTENIADFNFIYDAFAASSRVKELEALFDA